MLLRNHSLLNREYTLINVLKALALIIYVQSPCNFLTEDYTEIFNTIYKWNTSSNVG
jgi:Flp pilus assembly pilin Flp